MGKRRRNLQPEFANEDGASTIRRSLPTGAISGQFVGGITGLEAGNDSTLLLISECYSIGVISCEGAGGIVGSKVGEGGGAI